MRGVPIKVHRIGAKLHADKKRTEPVEGDCGALQHSEQLVELATSRQLSNTPNQ